MKFTIGITACQGNVAQMKIAIFVSTMAALLLAVAYFIFANRNEEPIQSVAILPFENMGNEAGQEYFVDGVTEGILNSLAQREDITVSARTSSFQFRGSEVQLSEVGQRLGVQTVLEGAILREGDRVRINVHLIDVEEKLLLWSQTYEGTIEDIFAIQDKIANSIAEALSSGRQKSVSAHRADKEAYDLYLKGRSHWNARTPVDLQKGIALFEEAIAKDPSFGAAYAGLADCYTALGYGSFATPKEVFPKAFEAATKALTLDSTLAEAHATLGYYKFYYEWDWAEAEQEFRKAISINPNSELCYEWYGYYLTAMQRYDEAKVVFAKAVSIDPLSAPIHTSKGFSLYYGNEYDDALVTLKSSLELNPNYPLGHLWLGRVYQGKKMYGDAITEYKQAMKATSSWPVAFAQIGNVYGVSGNSNEARTILDSLTVLSSKKFVTSYGVALVHAGLGEKEETYKWLNKAYEERSHWLVWLKTDPRWSLLKSDKEFAELLSKIGMPHVNE